MKLFTRNRVFVKETYLIFTFILLFGCGYFSADAQNFQNTLFDASPISLNPAYIGLIDGNIRANANYRRSIEEVVLPYVAYGASVDAPIYNLRNGDYVAVGVQANRATFGDGNLKNFVGTAGVAYQMQLGNIRARRHGKAKQLSIGVQVGYMQSSVDMSEMYFNNGTYFNSTILPSAGSYTLGLGNSVELYTVNAGVAYSQATNSWFNYVVGVNVQHLNQPSDALLKKQSDAVGNAVLYAGTFGCNVLLPRGFSLHPAILAQYQNEQYNMIAGTEVAYLVLAGKRNTSITGGFWYRNDQVPIMSAGIKYGGYRLRFGMDFNAANGNSDRGMEFALSFINPGRYLNQRRVPCTRF